MTVLFSHIFDSHAFFVLTYFVSGCLDPNDPAQVYCFLIYHSQIVAFLLPLILNRFDVCSLPSERKFLSLSEIRLLEILSFETPSFEILLFEIHLFEIHLL